jgi:hypothetical protein
VVTNWHSFRDGCTIRTDGDNAWGGGIKVVSDFQADVLTGLIIQNCLVEYAGVRRDGNKDRPVDKGWGIWSDQVTCTEGNENIYRNNVVRYGTSGGFFCEKTQWSLWHHNLAHNIDNYGLAIGAPFDPSGPLTHANKFYHFTLVENGAGGSVHEGNLYVRGGFAVAGLVVTDNILRNFIMEDSYNHEAVFRNGGENDGTYGSGNVYEYLTFGAEYTDFVEWGGGITYDTYAALETAVGYDLHEVTSAITFDTGYLLPSGSPAIDAGLAIAGINDGYYGSAPDLGWAEATAVSTSGTLNGGGSIAATTTTGHATSVTVNGGGSITVTANEHHYRTAVMNGGGSLSVTVAGTHEAADTINGGGSIAATTTSTEGHTTSATLNGGGSIAATVTSTEGHTTSATLNGGGSLSSTVTGTHAVSATVNGGGGVTPLSSATHSAAVVANGGGSISATASQGVIHSVTATLNGGGSINATIGLVRLSAYLQLDPAADPQVNTDHYLSASADILSSDELITLRLWSGSTFIVQWTLGGPSTGPNFYGNFLLSTGEADLIGDYADLWLSVQRGTGTGHARLTDVWVTIPYPPPVATSGELNGGGSIAGTVSGTHIPRAFPDLSEGLLGPAMNGGGSITASAYQPIAGVVSATMNGGGSITPAVEGHHATTGDINGGGSINPTAEVHSVAVTMNGGGRIIASTAYVVIAVTMSGGGQIIVGILSSITRPFPSGHAGVRDQSGHTKNENHRPPGVRPGGGVPSVSPRSTAPRASIRKREEE